MSAAVSGAEINSLARMARVKLNKEHQSSSGARNRHDCISQPEQLLGCKTI